MARREFTVGVGGDYPDRVSGMLVGEGFFEVFGAAPLVGRTFSPSEFENGERVLLVGHDFWQQRFDGADNAIGKSVLVDGEAMTLVGVMPEDFRLRGLGGEAKDVRLWVPFRVKWDTSQLRRSARVFSVVGRLRAGVSPKQAEAELAAIADQLAVQYPKFNRGYSVSLQPLREVLASEARPAVLVVFGSFALLWLICVVNVSNLVLARSIARDADFAVRAALGASRFQLARVPLAESAVISASAAAVAFVIADWAVVLLPALIPTEFPRPHAVQVDVRAGVFLLSLALASTLACGLLSVMRHWRTAAGGGLGHRGTTLTAGRRRAANTLVVAQVALATVLSIGAVLMVATLIELQRVPLDDSWREKRVMTLLLMSLSVLGQVLAALGIYGVMAAQVNSRIREIGIRIALGARARQIERLVAAGGVKLALPGLAAGLLVAFGLTRLLSKFLFNVSPTDWRAFLSVALIGAIASFLACFLPCRRAARVDPAGALRQD